MKCICDINYNLCPAMIHDKCVHLTTECGSKIHHLFKPCRIANTDKINKCFCRTGMHSCHKKENHECICDLKENEIKFCPFIQDNIRHINVSYTLEKAPCLAIHHTYGNVRNSTIPYRKVISHFGGLIKIYK